MFGYRIEIIMMLGLRKHIIVWGFVEGEIGEIGWNGEYDGIGEFDFRLKQLSGSKLVTNKLYSGINIHN
jgi:hypothetical protein